MNILYGNQILRRRNVRCKMWGTQNYLLFAFSFRDEGRKRIVGNNQNGRRVVRVSSL